MKTIARTLLPVLALLALSSLAHANLHPYSIGVVPVMTHVNQDIYVEQRRNTRACRNPAAPVRVGFFALTSCRDK